MRFANQLFTYAGANLLNAAIPFLLLPLLTNILSPADYGVLSLIQIYSTVLLPFITLNIHGLISVDFYRVNTSGVALITGTGFWLSISLCAALTMVAMFFHSALSTLLNVPSIWLILIPTFCFVQLLPTIVAAVYQAKKQPWHYSQFKIALTVLNVTASILFVVELDLGWQGRLLAIMLANLIFSGLGMWALSRNSEFRPVFKRTQVEDILKFGVPLILHAVSAALLATADRVILGHFVGLEAIGKYTVVYQVSSILTILFSSVNQTLAPHIFSVLTAGGVDTDRKLIILSYKIMASMLFAYCIFVLIVPFLMSIFLNDRYHVPITLFALIGLGFLFQGFYFVATNYIFYNKKTHILSVLTVVGAAVTIGLNILLIQEFGIFGCAVAMAASWLFLCLATWKVATKIHPMPWLKVLKEQCLAINLLGK